jgi:RHS repeat-associated protein
VRQRAHRAGSEEPLSWGVSGGFRPECVPKDSAGNRLAEQIDDVVTSASYNNMNQLVSQQAGGALVFKGTVSELANVTIAGRPAVVTPNASQPPSQDFQGAVPVPAGGQVQVTATDPSGNTRTSTYQVATGTPKAFTYDLNGNMASDGTRTYEWDAENRLVAVKEGGTAVAAFTYNNKGIRTSQTAGAVITTYVLEGARIVEVRSSAGGTTRYLHGPGSDDVVATVDASGASSYYVGDHLGSVRQKTDGTTGQSILTREYDPWGRAVGATPTERWAYTGREWDSDVGLYYYRARYYDPMQARFISEDPIRFAGGDNFYAYVRNNPVTFNDPLGLVTPLTPAETSACRDNIRRALGIVARVNRECSPCRDYFSAAGCGLGDLLSQSGSHVKLGTIDNCQETRNPAGGYDPTGAYVMPNAGLSIYICPYACRMGAWVIATSIIHELMHKCRFKKGDYGESWPYGTQPVCLPSRFTETVTVTPK